MNGNVTGTRAETRTETGADTGTGHPIRLGRRRLWEQFALRGAGFPADGVLELAPPGLAAAADKFTAEEEPTGEAWEEFTALHTEAAVATAHRLREIAASPRFRAAVAWQNPTVLRTGIAPFLKWEPSAAGRTSMPRQREELVAHYWQRFCVKNDTIGFFGPVGWGRWDPTVEGVAVDPGRGLIAATEVYFAGWAVDALAEHLDRDPALREWTAPRPVPFVRVEGNVVRVPGRPPRTVDDPTAEVLALCDGVRTAREIRAALPAVDVAAVLEEAVARRWAVWRLEIPASTHPERWLRAWLEGIDDPRVRDRGLAALEVLERGRERVRAAGESGDADELVAALSGLEGDFTALTDTAAVREKSASTAPCRALVYSDARRSATVRTGRAVREALAPLDPLLTAAGWLTSRLAEEVMDPIRAVHTRLAADGPVGLADFWFACMPVLHGEARGVADRLQREFREHWWDILKPPPGAHRVRGTLTDIESAVEERFGGGRPGWTAARYLSPDVMIAATGPEAVARGDFELVLGELHLAANTLGASLFVHQHPDPGELVALTDRDHPGPRLMPLLPKEHRSRLSGRIRHALVRPTDYQVGLVDFTADPRRPRTVRGAEAEVVERDGEPVVLLPDGATFPAVEVFSHALTTLSMDLFDILPEAPHTPRVTIDRLVVARETWRLPAAEADFAEEKSEARRYVGARRWRERHRLPRFVFVVSPTEPRPFYVDFDSPVYTTILAKAVRRLARREPGAALDVDPRNLPARSVAPSSLVTAPRRQHCGGNRPEGGPQ
ncbi:lantibiotic dehydratase [Streptomyces alkaliphilus]|uniref:Lantibiotic dehydratase n=1 Tax=Streptomyces alkaliphilus TaxID=1472722 RepID=A0A7W3TA54_9ACTN|nr:lantibiotic dehydratase [Streptomyces alkaliphilus]MBB0243061.1 lantibiotic dehydratase [Streptomyces alkaliphilus]